MRVGKAPTDLNEPASPEVTRAQRGVAQMRVASLVPSGTDIVAALGLGSWLVGVSHSCDHPVVEGLPRLTASSLENGGDGPLAPAEIDARVRAAAAAGSSLYTVDRAALHELAPDVVIGQAVCEVCAASGTDVAAALPSGVRLVLLNGTDLDGLADDLRQVGAALEVPDRAAQQIRAVEQALASVADRVADAPRPAVLTLEWGDPPFVGGHWVPELVERAGGRHLVQGTGEPSRRMDWAEVAAADPDVLVFMPCGYRLEAAAAEATALRERPEVAELRAVREGRLWAVDAARLFSRLTPGVVTAVPVLAAIAHPDRFPTPGRGKATRIP